MGESVHTSADANRGQNNRPPGAGVTGAEESADVGAKLPQAVHKNRHALHH